MSLASDFSVERRARTWKLLADTTFSKPTVMKLVVVVLMMVALLLPRRLFSLY